MLDLRCLCGLSPVVMSRGYSLAVIRGLLIVVAFLVAEHRLYSELASAAAARGLGSCGSRAPEGGLGGCSTWTQFPVNVESFQTRDRTRVPCIGRQILEQWTREICKCTLSGEICVQVDLKVLCISCLAFAWLSSRKPSLIYLCLQLIEHRKHPFQLFFKGQQLQSGSTDL